MNKNDFILSNQQLSSINSELSSIQKNIDTISQNNIEYEEAYNSNFNHNDYLDPEIYYSNSTEGQLNALYQRQEELEELLFKNSYAKKMSKYESVYKENISNYATGKLLNDTTTTMDLFNRKNTAITIANTLCNTTTHSPFNVAILGNWGHGKTTFIKYIQEGISKNSNSSKIHIVNYNASEYSSQEQIWANIASKLFKKYEFETHFAESKYYYQKFLKNKKQFIKKVIINILVILLLILTAFATKFTFSFKNLFGYLTSFGIGLSGSILLVTKIIIPFFQRSLSSSISLSNKIIGKLKLPSYIEKLGTRAQLTSDINLLLSAWIPNDDEKIIIFVDELDRCSEKGIVEFFESIQLLISTPKLFFVFAIDPLQLSKAINSYYKSNLFSKEDFTNNYLDKYVAVTIPLHNNIRYSDYVTELIKEVTCINNTSCFSIREADTIKTCIDLIPNDKLTPRKVKKIINALLLLKEHCVKIINQNTIINFRELIAWYIFSSIYKKESAFIISIFDAKREYTPLSKMLNYSHRKVIHENPTVETYINMMETYCMHDILIYEQLSITLSITSN